MEATYKAEIVDIVEHLNRKYKEEQFAKIAQNHENDQPNINSTMT